jgi:hypothetical protein
VYNKPYKGFDGFRHAVFGDTITVERHISRIGQSSAYLLKDQHGRRAGCDGATRASFPHLHNMHQRMVCTDAWRRQQHGQLTLARLASRLGSSAQVHACRSWAPHRA